MKMDIDSIVALATLLIVFYMLWYLLTHSPAFVTYSDLFTMLGGMLAFFTIFLTRIFSRINKLEERVFSKFDNLENKIERSEEKTFSKMDKVERKINALIREFSYFKGLISKRK